MKAIFDPFRVPVGMGSENLFREFEVDRADQRKTDFADFTEERGDFRI
jgi:hypothetical protein